MQFPILISILLLFSHLLHIGAGGFTERRDGVDGGDTLRQEGVGGELGELSAPQIGGEDALAGHPVLIHTLEHLDGSLAAHGFLAADQHLPAAHSQATQLEKVHTHDCGLKLH